MVAGLAISIPAAALTLFASMFALAIASAPTRKPSVPAALDSEADVVAEARGEGIDAAAVIGGLALADEVRPESRDAVDALHAGAGNGDQARTLGPSTLEVAILDAKRPRRAFRRITGAALEALLPAAESAGDDTQ